MCVLRSETREGGTNATKSYHGDVVCYRNLPADRKFYFVSTIYGGLHWLAKNLNYAQNPPAGELVLIASDKNRHGQFLDRTPRN